MHPGLHDRKQCGIIATATVQVLGEHCAADAIAGSVWATCLIASWQWEVFVRWFGSRALFLEWVSPTPGSNSHQLGTYRFGSDISLSVVQGAFVPCSTVRSQKAVICLHAVWWSAWCFMTSACGGYLEFWAGKFEHESSPKCFLELNKSKFLNLRFSRDEWR